MFVIKYKTKTNNIKRDKQYHYISVSHYLFKNLINNKILLHSVSNMSAILQEALTQCLLSLLNLMSVFVSQSLQVKIENFLFVASSVHVMIKILTLLSVHSSYSIVCNPFSKNNLYKSIESQIAKSLSDLRPIPILAGLEGVH